MKTEKTELEEEAQEEYDRAFSEAMAAGTDLEVQLYFSCPILLNV